MLHFVITVTGGLEEPNLEKLKRAADAEELDFEKGWC